MASLIDAVSSATEDGAVESEIAAKIQELSVLDNDEDEEDEAENETGSGLDKQKKKKKKPKKKKSGAAAESGPVGTSSPISRMLSGHTDYYVRYGQTVPPSKTVASLFPDGGFPIGEIQPHGNTKFPVDRYSLAIQFQFTRSRTNLCSIFPGLLQNE